jgi:hypothetical protein
MTRRVLRAPSVRERWGRRGATASVIALTWLDLCAAQETFSRMLRLAPVFREQTTGLMEAQLVPHSCIGDKKIRATKRPDIGTFAAGNPSRM